jgi:hypothetical protein
LWPAQCATSSRAAGNSPHGAAFAIAAQSLAPPWAGNSPHGAAFAIAAQSLAPPWANALRAFAQDLIIALVRR